jgi:hypothetical protein
MPPNGFVLGEHSGNDGDDWKWRRVGRLKDGVEGISSRTGLLSLLPGVAIVKLKLDGRRFGGVGGLINNGDGGAELFFSLGATAIGAGVCARRLLSEDAVLIPRFLRLRGFFAGVVGRCSSKKVLADGSPTDASVLLDLKSATKDEDAIVFARGDSGDTPGEGSVTDDESMVEMVVVGELSEEPVEVLSRLSLWMWKEEKGAPVLVLGLVAGRTTFAPF